MTRTKAQKAKAKANRQRGNQAMVGSTPAKGGLDQDAMRYARLLKDPCKAPLVYPVGFDPLGGTLMRAESDAIFHTGATDTVGAGYFCPAAIDAGGEGIGVMGGNSDTASYAFGVSASNQPFWNRNVTNSAFRCIAACIQVSYPGSELSRQGVLAMGQCLLGHVRGTNPSVSDLRGFASSVMRMPDGTVELRMVPNTASMLMSNVSSSGPTAPQFASPALFWAVSGLPPGVGVRVRFTCVMELLEGVSGGQPLTSSSGVRSGATLNQVVQVLERTGNWAIQAYTGIPNVATNAARLMSG